MMLVLLLIGITAVFGQQHGHNGHTHTYERSCIHDNAEGLTEMQVISEVISDMDQSGDGLAQIEDVYKEFITNYDHDGSGRINEVEFVDQWYATYHDSKDFALYLFHHFDRNDDYYLTKSDIDSLIKDVIDTNGDDKASSTEFITYLVRLYTHCVPEHPF